MARDFTDRSEFPDDARHARPDAAARSSMGGEETLAKEASEDAFSVPGTSGSTSPAAAMRRHLPRIEGYKIVGVVGQGGMGIVYRAVQAKLNRTVALKVLPAIVGSANPSAVARFRREATAAARLHHTNIVPIYDFGESRDTYYYAMELVQGQPLSQLIRTFAERKVTAATGSTLAVILRDSLSGTGSGPATGDSIIPWEESAGGVTTSSSGRIRPYYQQVARWMAEASEALHYAHSQAIIHRDIKPANLILSTDGRIMVADFGLAKSSEEESVTMTGALLGTLRYISPEQAMARRVKVDHRTDIYSLGAVMYELLCLKPAFPGTDDKEVLGAIISKEPTPPRKIVAACPAELETICLKALEKSPDARYLTAREMAEDLRRFMHDLPIVARRPGLAMRALKFSRRRKALVLAVAVSVVLAATLLFLVREQGRRRAAQREQLAAEVESLNQNAMLLARDEKWALSEAKFRDALALDPSNFRALLGLVWMKLAQFQDQPEQATAENLRSVVTLCERALTIEPGHKSALLYYGVLLKKLGRYEEAITATKKLLSLWPESAAAWSNLGSYHCLLGNVSEAREMLRKGAELAENPDSGRPEDRAHVWRNLAAVQLLHKAPGAQKSVARALRHNNQDVVSWLLQSRIRLSIPEVYNPDEALVDAMFAERAAAEENPLVKRMLALAHLRRGDLEEAVRQAETAIRLGDVKSFNHLLIAIAKAKLGNPVGARDHITAALDAWPAAFSESPIKFTFDEGVLWFESHQELTDLREEAEREIQGQRAE